MSAYQSCLILCLAACLRAQDGPPPVLTSPFPPPVTQIEAFQPLPGSVYTIAQERFGPAVLGVVLEIQEIRDSAGKVIRGVMVDSAGTQSYLDPDELAGLVNACDMLLDITSNPSQLRAYEAHYTTRGSLELTAAISPNNNMQYRVKVGRFRTREITATASEMRQLRDQFAAAAEKLASLE